MTKPFRLVAPKALESDLQDQILDYLALEQAKGRVAWFCRMNSGAIKSGLRYIRYYVLHLLGLPPSAKGKADIEGMLAGGKYFALEVKRPGEKPTPEQVHFLSAVRLNGGIAAVVFSYADARSVLFDERDANQ